MATVSPQIADRARKNHSEILQALATVGQARVAELVGSSESTVSRLKSQDLEQLAAVLAACGLKVAPEEHVLVEIEDLRALKRFALKGVEHAALPSGFGSLAP